MDPHDEGYMRLALEQAKLALDNDWIPVGAVFVKDHRVITHGRKTGIPHPLFDHAEHNGCYQALWSREGPKNLEGFTVYSTLEPCLMCISMLMTTRVNRIVYGLGDPYGGGGFVLARPSYLPARFRDRRPAFEGGLMSEASRELLRQYFLKRKEGGHWADLDNALVKLVMGAECR